VGNSIRIRALRAAGISIGAGVQVGSHVQFGADNLVLGKGSVVGDHVKFVGVAHIHVPMNSTLDANSSIGDVRISTGGSGLAIHYPVTATGKVPGVGRPPRIGGAETAAGEAGHGTN
jgi:acetyltransferase-like isoleucine patch superfamily enzyme